MIIDTYHNDITAIVHARLSIRLDRKVVRRIRYYRKYQRNYAWRRQ